MSAVVTPPMRVLLVDDEPPALLGLRALLSAHADMTVVGEAAGGRAAIAAARALAPDLVLLDVQMPEVGGFAVADALLRDARVPNAAPPPVVVFVTAYDAHALRAFDVGAADYLLKPVAEARFAAALARARAARAASDAAALVARLERVLASVASVAGGSPDAAPVRTRVGVRIGRRDIMISVSEIDWIDADGYCAIVHHGGRAHVVRQSLQAFEAELDRDEFVRVHRSAIVRVAAIAALERGLAGGLTVVLRDGTRLPVSRARRSPLLARVGSAR